MKAGKQHYGFTIVELLIVIVVIGILATITIVAYNGITNRANISASASAAAQGAKKIAVYLVQNSDQVPANLAVAGLTNGNGTTYQYTTNTTSSPQTYCLTATIGTTSSHIATGGQPTSGPCSGHTGVSPTALADGSLCPTGYIIVPGSSLYGTQAFCVMKYEAKNVSGIATSTNLGLPWVSITQTSALTAATAACSGCHLITDAEWLTIAQNVLSINSNWSGGTVGSGYIYSGHTDNIPSSAIEASANDVDGYLNTGQTTGNQRRTLTLSNGEVIWDLSGNVNEWTQGTTTGNQPGNSGFTWREWNTNFISNGSLSPSSFPSYANAATTSWTGATNGIGQVYSSNTDNSLRGFIRSGSYGNGTAFVGIFTLILNAVPSYTSVGTGFRIAR
ncbi:MAG: type II secretion system protein [Candidatus Microsaccharimonas sp.]